MSVGRVGSPVLGAGIFNPDVTKQEMPVDSSV